MAKYCMKCGFKTSDETKICSVCGFVFPTPRPTAKDILARLSSLKKLSPDTKVIASRFNKLVLPLVAVAALILVFLFGIIVPNTGAKGALRKYFSAMEKQNVKKYIDVMPEGEKQIYDIVEGTKLEEEVEEKLSEEIEKLEELYGNNVKIDIKITKVDDMTVKELKLIKSTYKLDEDLERIEIEEGVEIDFDIEYKGKDDSDKGEGVACLIKEDGKWKVYEVDTDI